MNNVFVYCETEGTSVADVSLELLTKGRKLANQLGCQLEAIVAGSGLEGVETRFMCSTLRVYSLIHHFLILPS